jgi:bifunctional non-homologous end joining protein LigD
MRKAAFISPMLLRPTEKLREGSEWRYELKHDGYRAIAFKSRGKLSLRSRNDKDFADRYPAILKGLTKLPDETVIDGEVVAFDERGRLSFNALQNSALSDLEIVFYVYDLMVLEGKDLMAEPFDTRRAILEKRVLPRLKEPVRYSATLDAALPDTTCAIPGLSRYATTRKHGTSCAKIANRAEIRTTIPR